VLLPTGEPPAPEAMQVFGTIAADGTITGKDGRQAHVHPDGSITGEKGQVARFKLEGDELVIDDKHASIDAEGKLHITGVPESETVRVEGATDVMSRRTALIIVTLVAQ
jgi:hypothetical protein